MITIIWPERRNVSERQIEIWYSDAVENGEITIDDAETVHDKALALDDAGLITLRSKIQENTR